jgi:hypothetical protein
MRLAENSSDFESPHPNELISTGAATPTAQIR